MDILTLVALILAVAIGVILFLATRHPDTFAIERSASMQAPPEKIFPLIASPKMMNTWMPFLEPDPNAKLVYSGPDSGQGAANTWAGNRQVGEGRIEVASVEPPSKVTLKLDMVKPMKAANTVVFTLKPSGSATNVTWAMSGRQPFLGKLMNVFIDCDKMVGKQFEKGLGNLKTLAER